MAEDNDLSRFLAEVSEPPDFATKNIFDVIASAATIYLFGYRLLTGGGVGTWGPALGDLAQRFNLIDSRIIDLGRSISDVMDAIQQMPDIFNETFERQYWEKRVLEAESEIKTIKDMMVDEAAIDFNRSDFRPAIRGLRNFLNAYEIDYRNHGGQGKLSLSFLTAVGPLYTMTGAMNDMFAAYVTSQPTLFKEVYPELRDLEKVPGRVPPSILHTSWGTHAFLSGVYGKMLTDYDQQVALNGPLARKTFPDGRGPGGQGAPRGTTAVYDFDGSDFALSHYTPSVLGGILAPEGRNLGRVSGNFWRQPNGQIRHWQGFAAYSGNGDPKGIVFNAKDPTLDSAAKGIAEARAFFFKAEGFDKQITEFRDTYANLLTGEIFA